MPNEDNVIDEIDALIATELDEHGVPLDDYSVDRYPRCELCQGHWHGIPKASGCPGGHASDTEVEAWRAKSHKGFQEKLLDQYVCQVDGVLYRLELRGTTVDDMLLATAIPIESEPESYAGAYSFNEVASQLMVRAMPAFIPDGFVELGHVDVDDGPAVDSSND